MPEGTTGRLALVTGGGTGIGRAIAQKLARRGYRVVATVRDRARATRLCGEAVNARLPIRYLALELSDNCQIEAVAREVEAAGGPDLVVHNAGFGVFGSIEDVDAQAAERQFAVNVFGPLALTRRLLPGLRERRGQIIWIGSLAGRIPLPFQGHYSASKSAIAAISDVMRAELAPHGVRVTCVEPSDFATEFTSARTVTRVPGSAYQNAADRCLREVERQERSAPNAEWVAKVVEKVARHPSPPARVPVGSNARLICLLLRIIPSRLAERLICWHYKL